MAGSAGPSTSNDTGRDRTMAGRWGPSTPPDMERVRDRTSKENRGPQAFQNVNRDGTWDINCMEQSTSQPVDRDRTQQNWDENIAGTSSNAFGESWRDSVTQRGNPELIRKYISAAIIGNQVDNLSKQIEDYFEFHQQIDGDREKTTSV
uniref:Uncharacterized protein n=1 Tax=Meloidogyne javanica TaxID=6303 RepID=A0A915MS39_MELJA